MFEIVAGDRVQARKSSGEDIAVMEFTVTEVTDGVYAGSPLGPIDEADGWTFELIKKGNPALPETLSDLAAWTVNNPGEVIRIVGPIAGIWQTPEGLRIDPTSVLDWVYWADLTQ